MKLDRTDLKVGILLVLLCLVVYQQAWFNEFLEWDDNVYVTNNKYVQQGLTPSSLAYAWTTFDSGNYIPLTWLSYELDVTLFGVDSRSFHAVNLAWHIVNCVLLFRVLRQYTGSIARSTVVASLFAVHPLHVESVAWISERKDVLSTCCLLLTLLAYHRYVRQPSRMSYAAVCVWFALGLLAKSMLVTLPVLLLIIDIWLLDRLETDSVATETTPVPPREPADLNLPAPPHALPSIQPAAAPRYSQHGLLALCLEKVPLLLLSLACAVVTVGAQGTAGAFQMHGRLPLVYRLGNSVQSYAWYVTKTLWPFGLSPFYPHPLRNLSPAAVASGALLLVVVSVGVYLSGRRLRIITFGWLWFLISLIPVIGLVQVGVQAHADRYAYVPHIGLLVLIVWQAQAWCSRLPGGPWVARTAAWTAIACCSALSWLQVPVWHDTEALWRQALRVDPDNELAHYELSKAIARDRGPQPECFVHLRAVLKHPEHRDLAWHGLGNLYEQQGDLQQAAEQYRQAIQANPRHARASLDLAAIQRKLHDQGGAYETLRAYAAFNPPGPEVWTRLGFAQMGMNRLADAVDSFSRAVQADPQNFASRTNLGLALWQQGQLQAAKEQLLAAVRLAPADANAHVNLGSVLATLGDRQTAIEHFQEALKLNPQDQDARQRLSQLTPAP